MRPIATDTHDFPSLRGDGKIYVDKTMFMHRLVTDSSSKLFFISRPRRFGKSLTVSALKALFSGRRELFEGQFWHFHRLTAGLEQHRHFQQSLTANSN